MAIPRDEISQPKSDREITEKTIKAIENADYDPTLRELVALAKALGMQLEITIKPVFQPLFTLENKNTCDPNAEVKHE